MAAAGSGWPGSAAAGLLAGALRCGGCWRACKAGKTRIPEAARQALAGESCSNRTQNGA
jgi:hypothetical protein